MRWTKRTWDSQLGLQSRLDGLKETAAILNDLIFDISRQDIDGI
jgi:hypothetical protein